MQDPHKFGHEVRDRIRWFFYGMTVSAMILGTGFLALWEMTPDTRQDVDRMMAC